MAAFFYCMDMVFSLTKDEAVFQGVIGVNDKLVASRNEGPALDLGDNRLVRTERGLLNYSAREFASDYTLNYQRLVNIALSPGKM